MRKYKKMSFSELVKENKKMLLSDAEELERIEERIDDKHHQRLKENG
ncbi:FbpB family small basic protein [Anaerobacillus arseniciselenatis]|nr:FbpB family small basic protein [Anaerobacillus arseniciselenatis]